MNGFTLYPEFLTVAEHDALLRDAVAALDAGPLVVGTARERVIRYGWSYMPTDRWMGDFPAWLEKLRDRIAHGENSGVYDSAQVNEYGPGQEIRPHVDNPRFGPTIAVVSLASDSKLVLEKIGAPGHVAIGIPPRSLYFISGEIRRTWTHAILPVHSLRYSIVFRSLKSGPTDLKA